MKKIISMLLCAVLVFGFFPGTPALAAGERLGGIEYSLLIKPEPDNSYPVTLKMENMTFNGTLSRGGGFSDEDRENVINSVLKEMNLTRENIRDAHRAIDLVKAGKSWGEILHDIRTTALKLFGQGDLNDMVDLVILEEFTYDFTEQSRATSQELRGKIAENYGIKKEATDNAKEAALDAAEQVAVISGKQLLKNIMSMSRQVYKAAKKRVGVITTLYDAMRADQKRAADKVASYTMRALLEKFYDKVNDRLKSLDKKGDWTISISDVDGGNFTFLGVPECYQTYNISMELVNKGSSRNADPNGVYEGKVKVVIEHEMSPFDRMILHYVRNPEAGLEYEKRQMTSAPDKKFSDGLGYLFAAALWVKVGRGKLAILEPRPETKITRTLTSEEFTIELTGFSKDKRFNLFYPTFSGFESETLITSTHFYELTPEAWWLNELAVAPEVYAEAKRELTAAFAINGANGDVYTERDYTGNYCEDQYVIYLYSNNPSYSQSPYGEGEMPWGGDLYPAAEIWDKGIWDKWENGDKVFMVDLRGSGR